MPWSDFLGLVLEVPLGMEQKPTEVGLKSELGTPLLKHLLEDLHPFQEVLSILTGGILESYFINMCYLQLYSQRSS